MSTVQLRDRKLEQILAEVRDINPQADIDGLRAFIIGDSPPVHNPGKEAVNICANPGKANFVYADMERIATDRTSLDYEKIVPALSGVVCDDDPNNYVDEISSGVYAIKGREVPIMSSRKVLRYEDLANENRVGQYCISVSRVQGRNAGVSYHYGTHGNTAYYEPLGIMLDQYDRVSTIQGFHEVLVGIIGTLSLMEDHGFTHYNLNNETVRIVPLTDPLIIPYPILRDHGGSITYTKGYPVIYNYETSSCIENGGVYGIDDPASGLYKAYYPISDVLGLCFTIVDVLPMTPASEFAMRMTTKTIGMYGERFGMSPGEISGVYSTLYYNDVRIPYNKELASIKLEKFVTVAYQVLGELRSEAGSAARIGASLSRSMSLPSERGSLSSSVFLRSSAPSLSQSLTFNPTATQGTQLQPILSLDDQGQDVTFDSPNEGPEGKLDTGEVTPLVMDPVSSPPSTLSEDFSRADTPVPEDKGFGLSRILIDRQGSSYIDPLLSAT